MMQPGQFIGQYQIVEPLGQGGMATVYKAFHARLNRHIAIKMIHKAHLEDSGFVARFEREAQIVAALEHPNIVPVYDFAEHEGQPYIIMKLIEGCTLKESLNDGPLQLKEILTIIPPLAAALDYAHAQGILHRDIKPSNIILDRKGMPYLTDFGLARLAQAGESTYSQDMLLGTPYYISPEQAMGDRELDKRTDLYSFGVVIYELLVGQVPYSSGTPLSIIHDHIYRPLPLPSAANPEIPTQVEKVLLKAIAKEADDRYQSGVEMVAALRETIGVAQLNALNPERRHTVAETLVRVRAEQQEASELTYKSSVTPTSKPAIPTEVASNTKRERNPLIVVAVVMLVLVMLVSLALLQAARQSSVREESPSIELYDVPSLTQAEAGTAVAGNPNDPASYLAVARAALVAGDNDAVNRMLLAGARITDDPVRYWLTVGTGAVESDNMDIAFAAYRESLLRSESGENYPQVRAFVGEQLYNAVLVPGAVDGVNWRRLLALREDQAVPPLLDTMQARALISNGRLQLSLAEREITRILGESPELAEAYLVRGDLYAARGRREDARQEWESARSQADAPQWVRERATELIEPS
jgi:serine/threonine-protein kinase